MIRIGGGHLAQEIRIDPMRLIALTQVRPWTDTDNAHLTHVALHCFAIDHHPFAPQLDGDAARTIERIIRIDHINAMLECHLLGGRQYWLVVKTRTAQTQEFGLDTERQLVLVAFDQR